MIKFFRLLLVPVLLLIVTGSTGQVNESGLTVDITDLRNNKGQVLISLYKDGKGYPDEPGQAFRVSQLSIINHSATVSFTGLPSGNYAIAILHDENGDRKMNTNFLGLPKEGYGFSNNVMGIFGPPSYTRALFYYSADERKIQSIRARY